MQKDIQNWYSSWFDTPFYHILYKDRDYKEAGDFMKNLVSLLKLPLNSEILDLACGKGRHAKYLNELGYKVTGLDLSPKSIAFAKQFENSSLHFEEHDMSTPYPKKFDAVFNLFTSFGYFSDEEDNLRTIKAIKSELKPNGYAVIDFLNVEFIKKHLVPKETKTVDGISFNIKRSINNGFIFKNIKFEYKNQKFDFTERVKAISLTDFRNYFEVADIKLLHCFGDYNLNKFDKEYSKRLILIIQK